jgi:hypothetical protein
MLRGMCEIDPHGHDGITFRVRLDTFNGSYLSIQGS